MIYQRKYSYKSHFSIIIFLFSGLSFAMESSYIQNFTITPAPAKAGQEINIKAEVLNSTNEIWRKNEYTIQVNFKNQKDEIRDSVEIIGDPDLSPGRFKRMIYVYKIPEFWWGTYKVEVFLKHRESLKSTLNATLKVEKAYYQEEKIYPKEKSFIKNGYITMTGYIYNGNFKDIFKNGNINGELNFDYRNFHDFHGQFTGSKGQGWDQMNLKGFLFHDKLFFSGFDISPMISNMAIGNILLKKGGQAEYKEKGWSLFGIIGNLSEAKEGYNYARYLYSSRVEINPWQKIKIGGTYAYIKDDKKSVAPIEGLGLAENKSLDLDLKIITQSVNFDGEYCNSNYDADSSSDAIKPIKREAYSAKIAVQLSNMPIFSFIKDPYYDFKYEFVDSDFISLGNPGTFNDRKGFYNSLGFYLDRNKKFGFSGRYDTYHDNVDNDPNKLTTKTDVINLGSNINITQNLFLNLNWSETTNLADDRTLINNKNISYSISSSQNLFKGALNLSENWSLSKFKDKTGISSDLDTNNWGVNISGNYKIFNYGVSYNLNEMKEKLTGRVTTTKSPSVNLNINIIPDKFSVSGWYSYSKYEDNENTVNNSNQNINVNTTYNLNKFLSLAGSYQYRIYKDNLNTGNNTTIDSVLNTRLTWRF